MMAPEAEQPAPPGPALERTIPSGAPGLADAEADGGARLRRPCRRLTPHQRAQQQAAVAARPELGSESYEASEGDAVHSGDERDAVEQVESESEESIGSSPDAVLDGNQPGSGEASGEAAATVSPEAIAARASKMFVIGAAEATASGLPPLASQATKALVKAAHEYMNDLKKADIDALSNSFGNFDRKVGLAWLIGDAVGSPWMERTAALSVGFKATRAAAAIKAEVRDAKLTLQRAACKLDAEDPQRRELEQQVEGVEARVLRGTADVCLSTEAAPARGAATGSRKRAREEDEEPSHEDVVSGYQEAIRELKKAVTRAEAELSRAAQVVAAKKRVKQRMASKLEGKLSDKQLGRFMRLFKEAHTAHLQALFDETQDENLLLQLKLELSELQRDMYFAEWGASVEQTAEADARADRFREIAQRAVRKM